MNNKLIIILGPTATGKTNLATKLAFNFNAEIISSDSRQVYKYLDIGTGKDLDEYNINDNKINYHLIDIIDLETNYSVYNFQKDFEKAYKNIISNNNDSMYSPVPPQTIIFLFLPIICLCAFSKSF